MWVCTDKNEQKVFKKYLALFLACQKILGSKNYLWSKKLGWKKCFGVTKIFGLKKTTVSGDDRRFRIKLTSERKLAENLQESQCGAENPGEAHTPASPLFDPLWIISFHISVHTIKIKNPRNLAVHKGVHKGRVHKRRVYVLSESPDYLFVGGDQITIFADTLRVPIFWLTPCIVLGLLSAKPT